MQIGTLTFFAFVALVLVPSAHGQAADHPSCAPWQSKWTDARASGDLAAMDGIIAAVPPLCANLKAETLSGRAAAAKEAEDARAAIAAAAARSVDPCTQARNDWAYMQTAAAGTVRIYRDALPAACASWRGLAEDRLKALNAESAASNAAEEARRKKFEQEQAEARRIVEVTAAAKLTGVEGRWEEVESLNDKCTGRNGRRIRIYEGEIIWITDAGVMTSAPITAATGERREGDARFPARASGKITYRESAGAGGAGETIVLDVWDDIAMEPHFGPDRKFLSFIRCK